MSDFSFYGGSDAQMMFGGGSGYYANVSYGSYGGSYSNYISTDDWENNVYQDRFNNLVMGQLVVFRTYGLRSFMRCMVAPIVVEAWWNTYTRSKWFMMQSDDRLRLEWWKLWWRQWKLWFGQLWWW